MTIRHLVQSGNFKHFPTSRPRKKVTVPVFPAVFRPEHVLAMHPRPQGAIWEVDGESDNSPERQSPQNRHAFSTCHHGHSHAPAHRKSYLEPIGRSWRTVACPFITALSAGLTGSRISIMTYTAALQRWEGAWKQCWDRGCLTNPPQSASWAFHRLSVRPAAKERVHRRLAKLPFDFLLEKTCVIVLNACHSIFRSSPSYQKCKQAWYIEVVTYPVMTYTADEIIARPTLKLLISSLVRVTIKSNRRRCSGLKSYDIGQFETSIIWKVHSLKGWTSGSTRTHANM